MYYVRFFGSPSPASAWSWRLGGHHISLNFTIIDGVLSAATPLFFGAGILSAFPSVWKMAAIMDDLLGMVETAN